jgi:hypothetical protein
MFCKDVSDSANKSVETPAQHVGLDHGVAGLNKSSISKSAVGVVWGACLSLFFSPDVPLYIATRTGH